MPSALQPTAPQLAVSHAEIDGSGWGDADGCPHAACDVGWGRVPLSLLLAALQLGAAQIGVCDGGQGHARDGHHVACDAGAIQGLLLREWALADWLLPAPQLPAAQPEID